MQQDSALKGQDRFVWSKRTKLYIHLIQLLLVHIAIGLSAPRMFMKNQPRTRASTIAMGMGAKSIIIIFYQLMTSHLKRFEKWYSRKANAILNCLEVVFWGAVIFLLVQANISRCVGVGCILSWCTVGVAIVITGFDTIVAFASVVEFRAFRNSPHRNNPNAATPHQQSNELGGMRRLQSDEHSDAERLHPHYTPKYTV